MKSSNYPKFSVPGFSPKRVAYSAVVLGFLTIPLQFTDDWRIGAAAFWFTVSMILLSGVLCLMLPRGKPNRFYPVIWLLIALMVHMLLAHL
jgi:hypothetical protein